MDLAPSGVFSVKSARRHIDGIRLSAGDRSIRWNMYVPITIDVFLWRVLLD